MEPPALAKASAGDFETDFFSLVISGENDWPGGAQSSVGFFNRKN